MLSAEYKDKVTIQREDQRRGAYVASMVNDTVEYSIGDSKDDLINKYLITIEKFDSDRVRGKISEFNERCFLNQMKPATLSMRRRSSIDLLNGK